MKNLWAYFLVILALVLLAISMRICYYRKNMPIDKIPYDTIRSSILDRWEEYDTLELNNYPVEKQGVRTKPQRVFTPVHIPKKECTEINYKYLGYKYNIYKRVGYNPTTQVYEGELVSKGSILTLCNHSLKFTNGISVVRGCLLEFVKNDEKCIKVRIMTGY